MGFVEAAGIGVGLARQVTIEHMEKAGKGLIMKITGTGAPGE